MNHSVVYGFVVLPNLAVCRKVIAHLSSEISLIYDNVFVIGPALRRSSYDVKSCYESVMRPDPGHSNSKGQSR